MKTKREIQEAIDALPHGVGGISEALIAARIALQWALGVEDEGTFMFEKDLRETLAVRAKRN